MWKAAFTPQMDVIPGILTSIPLMIFCVMYQQNVPQVYSELNQRSLTKMRKVLIDTSVVSIVVYAFAGFFGYVTWVEYSGIENLANS